MNKNIIIKNIYYMLSYAFQTLNHSDEDKIAKEEFENIHNLFAAILSCGIAVQLKRGNYRNYINIQDNISTIRGKINIQNTMRNKIQCKRLVSCEFDELSENNILNQILKSTAFLLIKSDEVDSEYRYLLKKQMLYFSNVDVVDLMNIKWSSISFHRNNQSYRLLIGICQLIAEGMLLTTDKGDYKLNSFINDDCMCKLYEKFLLEYFKKHFPDLLVSAPFISWILDDGVDTMLPKMKSDITIKDKEKNKVLIIDAKFYSHTTQVRFDKHTVHSNNLYQIFTYVKNCDYSFGQAEHCVSGMLLYAKTDEEIQPNQDYMMSGNKISVKTLDLNQEFVYISEYLNNLIQSEFYK